MSISPVGSNPALSTPAVQPGGQSRAGAAAPEAAPAQAPQAPPADKADPSASRPATERDAVQVAVDTIQSVVGTMTRDLQFSIDEELKRTVIKVVDTNTDEVIRQIPAEEVLDIARSLNKLQGLLVRQTA